MTLFVKENFISHAGKELDFKIECDGLSHKDWETLAYIVSKKYKFRNVIGVPKGGLKLSQPLQRYNDHSSNNILIVDDVLTTGMSMEEVKKKLNSKIYNIIGIVVFARNSCPEWINPIFKMWG